VAETSLIEAFISAAAARPAAPFIVWSDTRPAEDRLDRIVAAGRRAGARLTGLGVVPGEVIGVMLPNWREWMVACVAAQQAGAVLLPIVTIYGAKELGFILSQSRASVLITPDQWRGVDYAGLAAVCGDLPDLRHHFVVGRDFDGLEADIDMPAPPRRSADDLAVLVYTSGTTADPKGVMHSSRSLLAELEIQARSRLDIADEVNLSPWPPGHVAGALAMLRFLARGVPLVAMDRWDARVAAELIDRHRVTSSSGTPFHLTGIMDAADRDGRDLTSLRNYIVGAAPVPPTLVERCVAQGLAVYHCYGSSEHPTITSGVASDPLDKQLHTEGRPMAGAQLRFVDDDGRDVGPGEEGEIATRGPDLFKGYFNTALDEAAFLPGGWYRTGDIGRLDADGYLLITDRKKDIIIRGGENISSREVEDLLLRHPAVADVAVVAAKDERMGEVVMACVVPRPGADLSLEAVRDFFFASGIARQKTPERLLLVESLPRNASGKVLKHELRRMDPATA
jgi:acyl-CoA synthetase (AMP-forming)/AMP-acid ligase II